MKLQKLDSERLEEVTSFLHRYRSFTHGQTQDRFTRFCDDFERFRVGMTARLRLAEEDRRRTASTFNVFRVLGVAHDEIRTHSAILADLLDPKGKSCTGYLFLQRFLVAVPTRSVCLSCRLRCMIRNGRFEVYWSHRKVILTWSWLHPVSVTFT